MEEGGHTYPQIRGESGWGIFCHSNRPVVTREVGEVICRQTRRQFLARISKGARPADYDGVCYSGNIHCTSSKLLLSECDVSITQQDSCPGGYTTVDCTSGICNYTNYVTMYVNPLPGRRQCLDRLQPITTDIYLASHNYFVLHSCCRSGTGRFKAPELTDI